MTMGATWTSWVRKLSAVMKWSVNSALKRSTTATATYTP